MQKHLPSLFKHTLGRNLFQGSQEMVSHYRSSLGLLRQLKHWVCTVFHEFKHLFRTDSGDLSLHHTFSPFFRVEGPPSDLFVFLQQTKINCDVFFIWWQVYNPVLHFSLICASFRLKTNDLICKFCRISVAVVILHISSLSVCHAPHAIRWLFPIQKTTFQVH